MTPAQLDALLSVHRKVNDPKAGSSAPEAGGVSDLLAFKAMRS